MPAPHRSQPSGSRSSPAPHRSTPAFPAAGALRAEQRRRAVKNAERSYGATERGVPPFPPPLPGPALGQFVPGFYCLVNICYRDAGEEQTNGRAAAGGVQTAGPAPSCIPSLGAGPRPWA